MEKFQEAREKAIKNIKIADHMLAVTYPLIKDAKLLLTVMDNIFLALANSIAAVLYYEALYKRIPNFEDKFDSKFNLFKTNIDKLKIDRKFVPFIQDVKNIITEHKKSAVEFRKGDRLVICSDNYSLQVLSEAQVGAYLERAKEFIEVMDRAVNERWKSL